MQVVLIACKFEWNSSFPPTENCKKNAMFIICHRVEIAMVTSGDACARLVCVVCAARMKGERTRRVASCRGRVVSRRAVFNQLVHAHK